MTKYRGRARYELSTDQWNKIKDLLPGKAGDRGRTAADNRLFIDSVLWILRSGARWSDMPEERYGKYKSVHKRFTRWSKKGIWEMLFKHLIKDRDNEYLMIDSTIVKAHQQAATFKKRSGSGAFPRRFNYENSHDV